MSLPSSSSEERFTTSESASPEGSSASSSNDNSPIRNQRPTENVMHFSSPLQGAISTPPTMLVDDHGNTLPNQSRKRKMHDAYAQQRLESTLYALELHKTTLFTKYGKMVYDIDTISKSEPLFHLTEATQQQIKDWKAGNGVQLYNYKGEEKIPGGLFNKMEAEVGNIGGRRNKKRTRKHSKKKKSRSNRKRRTKHKR